jgi:protein SCO1/2
MTLRTIGILLASLLAGAALAVMVLGGRSAPQVGGDVQIEGKALVGGPFSLTDQTGKRVTEKDFLGKYMVIFFGFTNCPDICPSGLQVLTAALDGLGAQAELVTPVFVTLDSQRDTPEKLALYLKSFHPKFVGLTGSEEEVAAAAKAYRVYYQKVPDDANPANYSYDHASLFYVMGKDGSFIAPIAHTNDVAEVSAALKKALR